MDILDNVTWVSYEGATALYQAYLSGEIDFAAFDDCFAAKYVDAGEDVVVGVVIGAERSQYFPDVDCNFYVVAGILNLTEDDLCDLVRG